MTIRSFGSLAAAATAAALPMAGAADAADMPAKALSPVSKSWVPQWQFSAEGGALISNYSRSAFPGGLGPAFEDKLGSCETCIVDETNRSGSLARGRNFGWYGALSIGREIDPVWDWRLSGAFNGFNANRRSAALGQVVVDTNSIDGFATTSRVVTETDRFKFATVDFDIGRKWRDGMLEVRAFAGFRAMGTDQSFNISDAEAKGLSVLNPGFIFTGQGNQSTQTHGRSNYVGIGPRIGAEGFFGRTFGVTGSASAAYLAGWRYSKFDQTQSTSLSGTVCDGDPILCVGLPFVAADASSARRSSFAGVGYFTASLGVAWRPTQDASIEVGYRVEYLLNARESFNFANASALFDHGQFNDKKDVLISVPYVKGVIRF